MPSTRRKFLRTASAAAVGFITAQESTAASHSSPKPNILFILDDQHRAMDLGCMGNPLLHTPNLDCLASEGVMFHNAIANCPVCTPSRAVLQTGKFPLTNHTLANDLPLQTRHQTLGTILRDHGYRTGYIGKWHLDGIPRERFTPPGPRRAGYDDFWAVHNCWHNYFDIQYYRDEPEMIRTGGYEPEVQTGLAIEFLQRFHQEPFYLFLSYGPPHAPYQMVPDLYKQRYDAETMPLRPNTKNPNRADIAGYYAHIDALDEQVGRLVNTLEELGVRDNTLIVFTSDHGDMLYSQGRLKKQQPWEESINVPLIFNAPMHIPQGVKQDTLFGTVDMTPTLLGLLGIDVPADMEGMDLHTHVLNQGGNEHDSVPIMDILPTDQAKDWNGRPWRGVRTKRYTYARFHDEGWVLYDNQEDPYQLNNLINTSGGKDLQEEMEAKLQSWMDCLNDDFAPVEQILAERNLTEAWQARQIQQGGTKWW